MHKTKLACLLYVAVFSVNIDITSFSALFRCTVYFIFSSRIFLVFPAPFNLVCMIHIVIGEISAFYLFIYYYHYYLAHADRIIDFSLKKIGF